MNYLKIYNQLIERARIRKLEGYKEKHHIVPKCLGGDNNKLNIVELTAREHFLCHLLLCEIYPENNKLRHALFLMAIGKQKIKNKYYIIGSRVYEKLKEEYSEFLTGRKLSKETCLKKSKSMIGKKPSKETIEKRKLGRKRYLEEKGHTWGNKISEALKGRKLTWERNRNKKVYQLDMNNKIIKEFESANAADRAMGGKGQNVGDCCRGKQNTAYGFKWCYVKNYNK